jgi:CheY-like chemotaxis protein
MEQGKIKMKGTGAAALDLEQFAVSAFCVSVRGEWLGENQHFSIDDSLCRSRFALQQHISQCQEQMFSVSDITLDSMPMHLLKITLADGALLVLCYPDAESAHDALALLYRQDQEAKDQSADSFNDLKVLIVDDYGDNLFVMQKQIEAMGANALCASDPLQAIEIFKTHRLDLIISDATMPHISGAELIRVVRDIEAFQQRPAARIVILTGDTSSDCFDECMAAGADEILFKPLSLEQLETLLREINQGAPDNVEEDDGLFFDDPGARHEPQSSPEGPVNLSEIYNFTGEIDDDELERFLEQYQENLSLKLGDLEKALLEEDTTRIYTLAHSLKTSALYVGAHELNKSSMELEALATRMSKIDSTLAESLRRVETDLTKVIEFLVQRRQ